jgi:hypothetical protein
MGEGLGAGGHSTRRQTLNVQDAGRFLPAEIIFAPWPGGRGGSGGGPGRPLHRPAERPGAHREIRDIANGCARVPGRRRDPRRRSACRPETNRADDLIAIPRQSSLGTPHVAPWPICAFARCRSRPSRVRTPPQCRIRATVPRHRDESRGLLCIAVDWSQITRDHRPREQAGAGARTPATRVPALQRSNPLSCASALSEVSGRAPMCWITSAAASAPSRAQLR